MTKKTTVTVSSSFVGLHHWPEAPDDVSYLRVLHRHIFGVKVSAEITADRQVEFHQLKAVLNGAINVTASELERCHTFSCEYMAGLILSLVKTKYPTAFACTVDEDGECSSTVSTE